MTQATLDPAVFDELREAAGADFVVELVDTFLGEAPTMLAELRDAVRAGDAERFRRTAHSLKSNANTFGAVTLGAMAKALELGGLASVAPSAAVSLDALDAEYAQVATALEEAKRG